MCGENGNLAESREFFGLRRSLSYLYDGTLCFVISTFDSTGIPSSGLLRTVLDVTRPIRPAVRYPCPDAAAIVLCRDLVAETAVDYAILLGSRASDGWDDESDLDIIVIHQSSCATSKRKRLTAS